MTVNIVFGVATDGFLRSSDASYTNARNGPADAATLGSGTAYYGQNNNGGEFATYQTFIGFNYSAVPATDMVVSCAVALHHSVQTGTSVARDLEVRAHPWQSGGVSVADWRTGAQLGALVLSAVVKNVQNSAGKVCMGGSDELLGAMSVATVMDFVLMTSRQRAGNQATTDEAGYVSMAEASGTANDPQMIYSTVTRSHFTPALGAVAQLSDGSMVHLVSAGEAVPAALGLWRVPLTGAATQIGTVGTTTASHDFAPAKGNQGLSLCVDPADNIYIVGKIGNAENTLAVKCWVKNVGVWTWTSGSMKTAALPVYDTAINNVSVAYHATANGTLMVVAGHTTGAGVAGGTGNELAWALLDATHVRTGAGTLSRATGSLLGSILPSDTSSEFNTFGNEVGTGLDVAADYAQPDWGYVFSFKKGTRPGANVDLSLGRYVLNAAGNGFTHTSSQSGVSWGAKDAGSRLRVLPVGSGQACVISGDADPGWGITAEVFQASGTTSGLVALGGDALAGESITNMPDGPAVATVSWWDAIYNATENSIWVYYRHASDATKLMRTSIDLNTYEPTRVETQVWASGIPTRHLSSVRVARNSKVTDRAVVSIAWTDGATLGHQELVDSFNLAPTAPVLTPRANFDATTAATFTWTFTDPNAGDTQSAYELEIEDVADSSVDFDSGKTTSATSSRVLTAGTLGNAKEFRWRVRTWDFLDVVSPWSGWGTFSTSAGGTVTITDPVTDNLTGVVTDEVQVTWAVVGTVQAAYKVILTRTDTAAVVSDTGWVASTAVTFLVTGMVSGVEHNVSVQVRNAALVLSGIGTRKITPSYGTPEVPLISVAPVPEEGYTLISVDNPLSGQPALGTTAWTMEAGVAEWTATGCTKAHSLEQAHAGTYSLKMTVTGSPVTAYVRADAHKIPVTPTERYTARMWVYVPVARTVSAAIDWAVAGGGAYVSTSAADVAVPAATWTEIQVTGTCPTGAGEASYGPTLGGSPANGVVCYVDDVILVAASDRPAVVTNRILRRRPGSGDPWEVLGTCDPDGSFRDYTAPGRVPMEYMIRGES